MAAEAEAEEAGNAEYTDAHMSAIFSEGFSFSGYERDYLGLSLGGRSFLDVSGVSGIDAIGDGRGAAFADFDNDGDLDVLLVSLQGEAHRLFRNEVGSRRGFLRVHLAGVESGRDAFGAVVRVGTSQGTLTKLKSGGSGFLAQHDPRLLFGLGDDTRAPWVEVTWPSGTVQRFERDASGRPFEAGSSLHLLEGAAPTRVDETRFSLADPLSPTDRLLSGLTFRLGEVFPDLDLVTRSSIEGGGALAGAEADSLHGLLRPGRRLLVNLWATWCIPCRREMPELERLAPDLAARGIDLVGLSIDRETIAAVPRFVEITGAGYPIQISNGDRVGELFVDGAVTVPLSVLLDDSGHVLHVIGGWSAATAREFERLAGHR